MSDFLTDFRRSIVAAVEFSGMRCLPRRRVFVLADLLDLPPWEALPYMRWPPGVVTLDRDAWRTGYWITKYALEKHGTLVDLPSYPEYMATFDFDDWIDWLVDQGAWHVLVDLQRALRRPGLDG